MAGVGLGFRSPVPPPQAQVGLKKVSTRGRVPSFSVDQDQVAGSCRRPFNPGRCGWREPGLLGPVFLPCSLTPSGSLSPGLNWDKGVGASYLLSSGPLHAQVAARSCLQNASLGKGGVGAHPPSSRPFQEAGVGAWRWQ